MTFIYCCIFSPSSPSNGGGKTKVKHFYFQQIEKWTTNKPLWHRTFCYLNQVIPFFNTGFHRWGTASEKLVCCSLLTTESTILKIKVQLYYWSLSKPVFIFLICHLPAARPSAFGRGHLSNWLELAAAAASRWWNWTNNLSGLTPPCSQPSFHFTQTAVVQKNPYASPV